VGGSLEGGAVSPNRRRHPIVLTALTLAVALCGQTLVRRWPTLLAAGTTQAQAGTAETGVRDALQRYSTALESLDANAVKKVQPSIPADNLAKAFKEMRELKVAINDVRVLSVDGTTARVSCRVTQTLTPKVGSKQATAVTRVMRLRRNADGWVIDGFER
jgi:hypothetical protein